MVSFKMNYIIDGLKGAFNIILSLDDEFLGIVSVSIKVSFASTFLATALAIPLGVCLGVGKFKGRELLVTIFNTSMFLPTVVVGLLLYSFLSRNGPLGSLGILFTPLAMIMGQCILAFPIIVALVTSGVRNLGDGPFVAARILGAGRMESGLLFLKEAKLIVVTSVLVGFSRVFSEVGVSMMIGGNIRFYTRNITTAIALETSRGRFSLGIALGIVLMLIAFVMNIIVYHFQVKKA